MALNMKETLFDQIKRTGPSGLSISELLALVLQRPAEADAISEALNGIELHELRSLDMYDERIADWPELERAALVAAVTLALRIARFRIPDRVQGDAPDRLVRYLATKYHDGQMVAGAVFLDAQYRIISDRAMFRGVSDQARCSPRDVLREALRVNAHCFVFFTTHPSGDASPSTEDIAFCKRLASAASNIGIEMVDFITLGDARDWCSLKRRGSINYGNQHGTDKETSC